MIKPGTHCLYLFGNKVCILIKKVKLATRTPIFHYNLGLGWDKLLVVAPLWTIEGFLAFFFLHTEDFEEWIFMTTVDIGTFASNYACMKALYWAIRFGLLRFLNF